ncbi:hypothetical protein [Paludisphaera soli]|uniref:hypothetical protein n=1 Tax=Paludisphaera soli TaxID=2712865 RepID=UPI0013EC22C3|nr:hypothetical protein [Paludisphaera soli]
MIGFRELVLIAMVFLALYGRSGVLKSERAQTVLPWITPVRRGPRRRTPPSPVASVRKRVVGASLTRGGRLFWFLTILAATAVAAWIVTRTLITSDVSP